LIATNLNILEVEESTALIEELNSISRMLQGLIKSLNIS